MNNSRKQQSFSDREVDDQQQSNDDLPPVSGATDEVSSAAVSGDSMTRRNGNDIGLTARLTDLFVGDGDRDSDLLMQRNTQEGTVVQWLQALDMQVMGACRADERLKPLLKLNVSSMAEDRLLSHLSQHFEPSEVGLLARCLCIPLVSIRVGKINKQGTRLIPTSARGNLVLSLLPTSDLHISFLGDDGYAERLSILRDTSDCSSVVIEGIPADTTGRSFTVGVPGSREPFYFWSSEKSKLVGNELLEKMRNLLERKPSLAELTGISNSRLQRFVHHLRTFLVGSKSNTPDHGQTSQSTSKPSRVRTCSSIIQSSLSPRPSSFKEGMPRNLSSLRNVVRDKLRRRVEGGTRLETSDKQPVPSLQSTSEASTSNQHKFPSICLFPSLSGTRQMTTVEIPSLTSVPPPYYCWCPPVQYMVTPPHTRSESFTLPPLSSLLAGTSSTSPNLSEIPLPPFLPLSIPPSQQIPVFTPLMCDPIVHIPVIDICSSGQAYLVSTTPAISITPLVQESESEKSARDTLRILLSGSTQFPSVLSNADGTRNILGGVYGPNSIAAMSLVSPLRRCIDRGDLVDLLNEPVETGGNEDGLSEGTTE
ncbi:hypothetical protein L2E82_06960 [Cichorium intybus]|uniref:Uncharacterized protein n=1 Tax=Cichorium intybus TaxID=13427 RepID=A0ACB9G4L8_CICIN|nr:hypothetical protein L2E82_06960 [Cichorium intybus]